MSWVVRNVHNEEAVLHAIEEDSSISIRQISRTLRMKKSTIHRILKENQLHAYHYTKVQHLIIFIHNFYILLYYFINICFYSVTDEDSAFYIFIFLLLDIF